MTSQAYKNNDVLLFLLQIWKTGRLMFLWLCFLPPILVEKSVVKLRALEAATVGDKKNNICEEWKYKYFRSSYAVFGK